MMSKKKLVIFLFSLAVMLNLIIISNYKQSSNTDIQLFMEIQSNNDATIQVFYSDTLDFIEKQSISSTYSIKDNKKLMKYDLPNVYNYLRIDLGELSSDIIIQNIHFKYYNIKKIVKINSYIDSKNNDISKLDVSNNTIFITTDGNDPYFVLDMKTFDLSKDVLKYNNTALLIKKIIMCLTINMICFILLLFSDKLLRIPIDIIKSRKLIFYLSKNDFKKKYAGSYFGIIWAFIQPVVTILLYWFVFQVGFRSSTINDFPFVLWLITGLIPWFFYSEGLSSATSCFLEYNYLVKKVVFNICILPIVKIGSALFVHIFFILFTMLIFIIYGYVPSLYSLQIVYYTICLIIFMISLSYITSSIVLFFRDFGQIINIYLQIAMWMTPIMWNYSMVPAKYLWIFKINPMYYIVEGYRDSLINHVWFFDKIEYTFYFWVVVFILYMFGNEMFRRLKPHFADVI